MAVPGGPSSAAETGSSVHRPSLGKGRTIVSCRRVGRCSSLPDIRQPIWDGALQPDDLRLVGRGETVHLQHCASCHGRDLQGQPDWQSPDGEGYLPAPPHDETGHSWHHPDRLLFDCEARREPGRRSEEAQKPHAGLRRRSRPRRRHRGPVLHQITLAFGRAAQARRAQSQPPASGTMSSTPGGARVIRNCRDYSNASAAIAVTTSAISPCRSSLCPLRADAWSSAEVMTTVRPRLGTT
jgi:hypothetical protein